jgi:hypothetical protein
MEPLFRLQQQNRFAIHLDLMQPAMRQISRGPDILLCHQDLEAWSGFPFRLVEAISSSFCSSMDSAIDFEAPFRLLFFVSPRFADRATPAAFC